jgi:ribulose-5-phosphate 4-epimerase/fuculose-1-phosphate aldolase
MAVCSLEEGLLPINFYACNFAGRLAYHDFEGITVRAEEGERLLANLADKNILMLRNHGPVVLAPTLQAMFIQQWSLQRACEIQMATLSMGRKPILVPDDVIAVHQRDLREARAAGQRGRRGRFQRLGAADRQDRPVLAGLKRGGRWARARAWPA